MAENRKRRGRSASVLALIFLCGAVTWYLAQSYQEERAIWQAEASTSALEGRYRSSGRNAGGHIYGNRRSYGAQHRRS